MLLTSISSEQYYLVPVFFLAAFLYTSVGHGGASAYLGILALEGFAPGVARFFALVLNLVASGTTASFRWKSEQPNFSILFPLLAVSVPAAFFGATFTLGITAFKVLAAVTLLYSAIRLTLTATENERSPVRELALWQLIVAGTAIGFVSGLIGIGGGIFLSPLLLFTQAATFRQTGLLSALFIFANSAAGLLGASRPVFDYALLLLLLGSVAAGGISGTLYSFNPKRKTVIRRFLALALGIAGLKILWQLIV